MLVGKGLITDGQLTLIRDGTRSRAVVTGMRPTGHETALIPASAVTKVSPGSVIDTYYRSGDESAIAVCVSPR